MHRHNAYKYAKQNRALAEYRIWTNMRRRCLNPADSGWPKYGGRGIKVCARWMVFAAFFADMGARPDPKLTLERIDNNGNYEPGNCKWATRAEQAANKRPPRLKLLTLDGVTLSKAAWAKRLGIKPATIYQRLRYGWSVERTLTTPVDAQGSGWPRIPPSGH